MLTPGTLIRSHRFAVCNRQCEFRDGLLVYTDGPLQVVDKHEPPETGWTEKQTLPASDGLGPWTRSIRRVLRLRVADPARGEAVFRVESVSVARGGEAHGPHDVYPDGLRVVAVRLLDGQPTDERIAFYQGGCFSGRVDDVEVVG